MSDHHDHTHQHHDGEPRPLADSLDALLRSLQRPGARSTEGAGRRATAGVFGRWDETVGDVIAAHARPVRLEGGRLRVEVDEPGWATQLRYLESDLLNRLRDAAGVELDGIDVHVTRPRGGAGW